jgi:hypothetical protein
VLAAPAVSKETAHSSQGWDSMSQSEHVPDFLD